MVNPLESLLGKRAPAQSPTQREGVIAPRKESGDWASPARGRTPGGTQNDCLLRRRPPFPAPGLSRVGGRWLQMAPAPVSPSSTLWPGWSFHSFTKPAVAPSCLKFFSIFLLLASDKVQTPDTAKKGLGTGPCPLSSPFLSQPHKSFYGPSLPPALRHLGTPCGGFPRSGMLPTWPTPTRPPSMDAKMRPQGRQLGSETDNLTVIKLPNLHGPRFLHLLSENNNFWAWC